MLPIVYLNGRYLSRESAALGLADLSILRGYGIFDYFRYVDRKPRFVDDHIERFWNSASAMRLEMPVTKAALREVVEQLIDKNEVADGGIRFVLTGGYSENGYQPGTPNLLAMAYPFSGPPATQYELGCNVMLHRYERQLPHVKTIDYVEGIRIIPLLKEKKADYPLYVDRDGFVRESDRSNFFIVKNGTIVTPKEDILLGITRRHVIHLARTLNFKVTERKVSSQELLDADEAIIASSTKGAMPITHVDGQPVGNGLPGPVTKRLMEAWPAYYLAH